MRELSDLSPLKGLDAEISNQLLSPFTLLLCLLWIGVWIGAATLITGGRKSIGTGGRRSTAAGGRGSTAAGGRGSTAAGGRGSLASKHYYEDAKQALIVDPWAKCKSIFKRNPIKSAAIFFKKLPRRIWNFYIEAFLIPSYRPEWKKYKKWSYKSPQSKVTSEKKHEADQIKRRDLKRQEMDKMEPHAMPHDHSQCQRIKFNINGTIFETQLRTVNRYPDSLLGNPFKRIKYYDPRTDTYFFDRMASSFEAILYFFQSGGELRRPENVHLDIFFSDAEFYELPENIIHDFKMEEGVLEKEEEVDDLPKNLLQRKIWLLFDSPESSTQARILAIISVFVIVLSIALFCVDTIPDFSGKTHPEIRTVNGKISQTDFIFEDIHDPFFFTETICSIWFTVEFLVRFSSSPNKLEFMKNLQNIIDLVSVLPYFVAIITYQTGKGDSDKGSPIVSVLRVIRLVRVFRVFKLSRYSRGLRILGLTLKSSLSELFLLIFFVFLGVIMFSSCLYFAELGEESTHFKSIPHGFWFIVITMTTVGYGEVVPKSTGGKVVASLCAVTGVLVIALPVPVIVSNFNYFYHRSLHQQDFTFTKLSHVESCPFRSVEEEPEENDVSTQSLHNKRFEKNSYESKHTHL